MKILLDQNNVDWSIRAYQAGQIQINDTWIDYPVIITKNTVIQWPASNIQTLSLAEFETTLQFNPEILLLGTGEKQQFPLPAITQLAASKQIGLEVMDTAAACRTYNVLLSEDRHVSAALFMR